jgi:hypothetical protein
MQVCPNAFFEKSISILLVISLQVATAQTPCSAPLSASNCPTLSQAQNSKTGILEYGMARTAQISVALVNTASMGTPWITDNIPNDPNNPLNATETALSNWLTIAENQQDPQSVIINNNMPSSCNTITGLEGNGTIANPQIVVIPVSPQNVGNLCTNGAPACSFQITDQNSHFNTGCQVYVSTDVIAGKSPATYPANLQQVLSHEIGVHCVNGMADCQNSANSGLTYNLCALTDSGGGEEPNKNVLAGPISSGDNGPTQCDLEYINTISNGDEGCPVSCNSSTGHDCPGGLTCMMIGNSGSCGCTNTCDDQSCIGWSLISCCADGCDNESCPAYDPAICGTCN